jgi:hypothetical protein
VGIGDALAISAVERIDGGARIDFGDITLAFPDVLRDGVWFEDGTGTVRRIGLDGVTTVMAEGHFGVSEFADDADAVYFADAGGSVFAVDRGTAALRELTLQGSTRPHLNTVLALAVVGRMLVIETTVVGNGPDREVEGLFGIPLDGGPLRHLLLTDGGINGVNAPVMTALVVDGDSVIAVSRNREDDVGPGFAGIFVRLTP